ncbi:MAG: 2-dehydro-3-deoxy-D-arabinonate dehydratase [Cellvibrionaceae bacterium]|jgi:2-dehydro-3-deoxy-D-arabinonate dehydratase
MYLTRHQTETGPCWALNGSYLPQTFNLNFLLSLPKPAAFQLLGSMKTGTQAIDSLLPPIEPHQEVWACGVTYLRSRQARMEESDVADVYERVYEAERPEIFFKSLGWRARGDGQSVRIRQDSTWDVPEPELMLVLNSAGEILGYTAGNDMSSRSIEGENPLYLPQAKTYDGSCAVGPGLLLSENPELGQLPIQLKIVRDGQVVFDGEANTNQMKRSPQELVDWLMREIDFPHGAFLMTGTCLVPEDDFTLQAGDQVTVSVGTLTLENHVAEK